MTPKQIFEERLAGTLAKKGAAESPAIYQFKITGDDGGDWVVDTGAPAVSAGTNDDANCTITVTDSDFVGLVKGEIAGPMLFMTGKLKVEGDISLAMQLGTLLS